MVMLLGSAFLFIVGIVTGLVIARFVRGVHREVASFKEAAREFGMPIVTFKCGDRELRFLIDTGAHSSFINKETLQLIPHTKCRRRSKAEGVGGSVKSILREIHIEYEESVYKLPVWSIDTPVASIPLKIDGVLGNDFMEHNGLSIDYISHEVHFDKAKSAHS